MARISFSPLIVEAGGKVKDTVFSRWKGRAYIRSRVTPANPNTSAQQAVRNSLARCVDLWQSFESQVKAAWNTYATPYRLSGYNSFVGANRADEQAGNLLQATPENPDVLAATGFSAATGSGSGEIDLTWTDPGQGAGYYAYVLVRKSGEDKFFVADHDNTLMSAESLTITGLTPGATYQVYLSSEKIADNDFSASVGDTAAAAS